MGWLDDPGAYYAAVDEFAALAQRDIVIVPTATSFPGDGDTDAVAPDIGGNRVVRVWRGADDDRVVAAPAISADVSWALGMVVPHNCAMEKEFDALVTVARTIPYERLPLKRERSVRSGLRLSAFPVVGSSRVPEGYVDLNVMTTVGYRLVPVEQRVAALSRIAQAFLQKKLAMHFAYRDDSDLDAIANAVGRRIVSVNVIETPSKKSARVKVAMTLEDGETLVLEGDAPAPKRARPPERQARGRASRT